MNEMVLQYAREYGMVALTSLLATFGGCLAGGCSTRVTGIGGVSEKPVFVFDGFGVKVIAHSLVMTFEHDEDEDKVIE